MSRALSKSIPFALGAVSLAGLLLATPELVYAYIGPGAGFAIAGSGLFFLLGVVGGLLGLLFWPFRALLIFFRHRTVRQKRRTRRVVVIGFDGLDPLLLDGLLARGKLPAFKQLAESGTYQRLRTTNPALSPVAWSSFQTGVNPGAHNIFDFISCDRRSYTPTLSSARTKATRKVLSLGPLRIPLGGSEVSLLRKSRPFWELLSENAVPSTVLRVPITYPAKPFGGMLLSAMCTPDLRGTQGSFTVYSYPYTASGSEIESGFSHGLSSTSDGGYAGTIYGPPNTRRTQGSALQADFTLSMQPEGGALLVLDGQKITLTPREFSAWVNITFRYGVFGKLSAIVQFCLLQTEETVQLYMSPLNTDPLRPSLPICCPKLFAPYLARRHGPFGTLGFLEDTWARNEEFLDDSLFLKQAYSIQNERERMFLSALDTTPEGNCTCVFDSSDRVQHIFWRYLDKEHPAPRTDESVGRNVIPDLYIHLDRFLGKVLKKLKADDTVIVLSDHGFTSFRREVDINAWLRDNGYLTLAENSSDLAYLRAIDWSRTKAYAVGLSGIYLNIKGREREGVVAPDQAAALKKEIAEKLKLLRDSSENGHAHPIREVYDSERIYHGLYVSNAPDLVVGYEPGYRVSWQSVKGAVGSEVLQDNLRAWSGDHCADPETVPGVLLCNRPSKVTDPHIVDLPSTILDLLGCPVPQHMEGRVIF